MDQTDHELLRLMGADARQSLAQLGAAVGLSPSAVNERVRRLQAAGTIRAIRADVAPEQISRPVLAFIWVALAPDASEDGFRRAMRDMPAICACHHVTGAWSYLLQIRVESLSGVEAFLARLKSGGWIARSETMLALSTVVDAPFIYRGA